MGTKEITHILDRLAARKERQAAALAATEVELTHWQSELEKARKTGK